MNAVIMWIMAVGAVIGGVDRILGNRLGLGKKFEEGFLLLGPTALSMAGIIYLVPLLSSVLEKIIVPVWSLMGLDASIFGGILALDMGGYQLAMELAKTSEMGRYAGIVIGATFGCTVSFTIPVGMGMLSKEEQPFFAKGILIGMGMMPLTLFVGGIFCGLSVSAIFLQSLPILILSVVLMFGIAKFPEKVIRWFGFFAKIIGIFTTIGLIVGAVQYMTGFQMIEGVSKIEDAMSVVSSIGIVMLGSLPVAEILKKLCRRPLQFFARKTGMNEQSMAGLLIGMVSPVPAMTMMKEMDNRGKVVNASFLVCAASAIAAHIGFVFRVEPQLVMPLFLAKLIGGIAGVSAALFLR